jgi:hypothetical protein
MQITFPLFSVDKIVPGQLSPQNAAEFPFAAKYILPKEQQCIVLGGL